MKKSAVIVVVVVSSLYCLCASTVEFGQAPDALPKIDTALVDVTWNDIVSKHYQYFTDTNKVENYGYLTQGTFYMQCKQLERVDYYTWYNMIVRPFYASSKAKMAFYKWVKPYYLDAYKKLPRWKQQAYKDMLANARKYIQTFDMDGEKKILKETPGKFHFIGPHGQRGPFARMQTFIFRRAQRNEMTTAQMLQWVTIFEKDIATLKL